MTESNSTLLVLEVAQILDRYNLVLVGNTATVREGERLTVVAIGQPVRGTNTPLIVRKAELNVHTVTDEYVIGETPSRIEEEDVPVGMAAIIRMEKTTVKRQVRRRDALNVKEDQMIGNPAGRPIEIGDKVIRWNEVKRFAASLYDGQE